MNRPKSLTNDLNSGMQPHKTMQRIALTVSKLKSMAIPSMAWLLLCNIGIGQDFGNQTIHLTNPMSYQTLEGQEYFSTQNLPTQPQVAKGRCQNCAVGIDCADNCGGHQTWRDLHNYDFSPLAHGEYLGPIRLPATIDYRVRTGDQLSFTFILSREVVARDYTLQVGDEIVISSVEAEDIALGDINNGRGIAIQPDGTIPLKLIGPQPAYGLTISQLRKNLEQAYSTLLNKPAIDVLPLKTNTLLDDIRAAVDARAGTGGQTFEDTVHPDGTIRLPKVGRVLVQGMTLDEMKREINLRYRQIVTGLELEPRIVQEAPHFVYVYGQVAQPGRVELLGPTSVTQALAVAGSVNVGGNSREIVVFRRAEDHRLLATRLDLSGAHLGKVPTPADEIWLRDNDLIIVPLTPIQRIDNFIEQVFTRGIYGVLPFAQVGSGFDIGAGFGGQ